MSSPLLILPLNVPRSTSRPNLSVFLDPYDNESYGGRLFGISINVATLLQETNIGSRRYRLAANKLPPAAQPLQPSSEISSPPAAFPRTSAVGAAAARRRRRRARAILRYRRRRWPRRAADVPSPTHAPTRADVGRRRPRQVAVARSTRRRRRGRARAPALRRADVDVVGTGVAAAGTDASRRARRCSTSRRSTGFS